MESPATRKIFILDDNQIDRETCRRHLSRSPVYHYDFVEHNSVDGAIKVVEQEKPDCILLDYHLHDGNGIEFINELSSLGGPKAFPVVMLTGTGSESIAVDVMKAGAQDYLIKDHLSQEVLQRTVEAAIYKGRTERLIDEQRVEMERLFREAQVANARKDQFLAALSHELRTPLTPVLAAVSATDVEAADRCQLKEVFSVIRRNIELEARLIDDMLDLTRISSGKLEISTREVDVHGILRHAVETCEEEIEAKEITLHWALEARARAVQADPARLQQVFWNLLKNAVKFTPAGGEITVATRDGEPGHIRIEVSDTGIGVEPDMVEKIFNAFEQGDVAVTRRYGGLGLGLAISKALIEAHDGTIRAENNPSGRGASFVVTLAAHTFFASASAAASHPGEHSPQAKAEGPRTILLVEDHEDSALLLSRIMEMHGYRVVTASSVGAALKVFQQASIDGIVSDIGLPDGSGVDLMERILRIRHVPAIALSGYGMERDLQRSLAAGFQIHLTKPVDWPKLQEALKKILAPETDAA